MDKSEVGFLKNVYVKYNDKLILEDINLSFYKSEFITIIGPNGTGKTTLLKTIAGLVKPYKGEIKIFNRLPGNQPKGAIGYLPQGTVVNTRFPVKVSDVVLMGRYSLIGYLRFPSEQDKKIARNCLEELNIYEYAKSNFQELSGGIKQRVLIARALASEPKLLLLDEPTTSLDILSQRDFYNTLKKLRDERELSIIVVSHDIGVVTQYVDKIVCLNKKIHYYGKADKSLSTDILEKVFGKNVMFIVHDKNCLTCGLNANDGNNQ